MRRGLLCARWHRAARYELECLRLGEGADAGVVMNMQWDRFQSVGRPHEKKTSFLRRIGRFFIALLSSPRGDQGGWEGGARGL
jgi:hypothetical protein